MSNRHPIDRLADVRSELRALEAIEAELRNEIVSGIHGLSGDQFLASVTESERESLDAVALRKHLGPEGVKPFLKKTTVRVLKLTERVHEDAE